jgi:nucleotide-binding universal stress UspA family protein
MDYRTILVHLDQSAAAGARTALAIRLAGEHQAHLVGVAQTGLSAFIRDLALPGADLDGMAPLFAQLREDAERCAAQFDTAAGQAGIASFEHRIGDEDPGNALATHAMYADLAIVSQHDPAGGDAGADIPEYVAMNAPCPVIVLPRGAAAAPSFERVLVAWNASPESARAVRQALPILQRATEVVVAVVVRGALGPALPSGSQELAPFLARHGVTVEIRQQQAAHDGDAGAALLALARQCGAGLLVMGCYGRSRFRELLLGGVSRTILRHLDLPVLMAH